jgi:hypothetical protein
MSISSKKLFATYQQGINVALPAIVVGIRVVSNEAQAEPNSRILEGCKTVACGLQP